jgi:predicted unusual protein kinase regulating ubiquinone biosynthesis (AarF/ABC1/UbiB family)
LGQPPLTEEQVVKVMEQELGVPWEDVFETIDPQPLAAGTIAQVHRATLADHTKAVVKVQRPDAKEQIEQDLALLEVFAEKVADRPGLKQVVDMKAVFDHLSESLHRELDFRREAENIERMGSVIEDFSRLRVPVVFADYSTSRLLVMQDIGGGPAASAPEGPARKEAARQLLESFYKQILVDGFFHADPHPGNLMWQPEEETLYFLDLGMIGEVGPDLREHMMLLLMAFWQQDVGFLTDVTLMLTGAINRTDLDVEAFQEELGALMARNRGVSLKEIQLGPVLQEMTEIALRYDVPLPASLTLTAKALAQMQLAAATMDPDVDPFDVAGKFMMRNLVRGMGSKLDPKTLFYQAQRFKVRFEKVVEAIERLIGARPGQKLEVNFRAASLETTIRRAGRRLAISLTAGAAILATALTAVSSDRVARWVPAAFGVISAGLLLALLVDLIRKRG